MKADKTRLREEDKAEHKAAKAAGKAQKVAERAEAKVLKQEAKGQKQADHEEFKTKKRAIKAGMKDCGFLGYQIKNIGKALNYSSLEEMVEYARQNNIEPTPKR